MEHLPRGMQLCGCFYVPWEKAGTSGNIYSVTLKSSMRKFHRNVIDKMMRIILYNEIPTYFRSK